MSLNTQGSVIEVTWRNKNKPHVKDTFFVAADPEVYEKFKKDPSIPLVQAVEQFQVFVMPGDVKSEQPMKASLSQLEYVPCASIFLLFERHFNHLRLFLGRISVTVLLKPRFERFCWKEEVMVLQRRFTLATIAIQILVRRCLLKRLLFKASPPFTDRFSTSFFCVFC
jgi:hypothetical protein